MSRRFLAPLGLAVTALLVVAAVAARGRPLGGGGRGGGPTPTFFDYVFTSVVIFAIAILVVFVWALIANRKEWHPARRGRSNYLATLGFLIGCALLAWAISTSGFQRRLQRKAQELQAQQPQPVRGDKRATKTIPNARGARLRWDEVAIVLALLAGAGVLAWRARTRRLPGGPGLRRATQEAVSAALDESLDDLRTATDLRAAIVAAYARMERALALAGLPRRPAEAPLEYVERTLAELETSGEAIARLTDLFEWAKFSQHEPEPRMRDEAVDALVAVRDELRGPEPVAA